MSQYIFSHSSVDTFPNKGSLGIVQETENEIIFNTDGLKPCNFAKFKILFKLEQLNPDQKSSEVTYKDNQRKGDVKEEIIKLEKIKVSTEYLISNILSPETLYFYFLLRSAFVAGWLR